MLRRDAGAARLNEDHAQVAAGKLLLGPLPELTHRVGRPAALDRVRKPRPPSESTAPQESQPWSAPLGGQGNIANSRPAPLRRRLGRQSTMIPVFKRNHQGFAPPATLGKEKPDGNRLIRGQPTFPCDVGADGTDQAPRGPSPQAPPRTVRGCPKASPIRSARRPDRTSESPRPRDCETPRD